MEPSTLSPDLCRLIYSWGCRNDDALDAVITSISAEGSDRIAVLGSLLAPGRTYEITAQAVSGATGVASDPVVHLLSVVKANGTSPRILTHPPPYFRGNALPLMAAADDSPCRADLSSPAALAFIWRVARLISTNGTALEGEAVFAPAPASTVSIPAGTLVGGERYLVSLLSFSDDGGLRSATKVPTEILPILIFVPINQLYIDFDNAHSKHVVPLQRGIYRLSMLVPFSPMLSSAIEPPLLTVISLPFPNDLQDRDSDNYSYPVTRGCESCSPECCPESCCVHSFLQLWIFSTSPVISLHLPVITSTVIALILSCQPQSVPLSSESLPD